MKLRPRRHGRERWAITDQVRSGKVPLQSGKLETKRQMQVPTAAAPAPAISTTKTPAKRLPAENLTKKKKKRRGE